MNYYPDQLKEAIVLKWMESDLSLRQFAKQEGLSASALCRWHKQFSVVGNHLKKKNPSSGWSAEQRFAIVIETVALSEAELSAYCREKGLSPEQVHRWKQSCIAGNQPDATNRKHQTLEHKADKKRIKELERALKRKDAALAEAAALLVLRKKLNAYWGEDEDS